MISFNFSEYNSNFDVIYVMYQVWDDPSVTINQCMALHALPLFLCFQFIFVDEEEEIAVVGGLVIQKSGIETNLSSIDCENW